MIHTAIDAAQLKLRPATAADLAAVNAVIQRAASTWELPERVKRLTMPADSHNKNCCQQIPCLLLFLHKLSGCLGKRFVV